MSMYFAIQKVVNDHNGVWSGLAAFVTAFTDFEGLIQNIQDRRIVQEKDTKGVTQDKSVVEDSLIALTFRVSQAVHAYATDAGNNALREKVNYSLSDLRSARDTILIDICRVILDEANIVVADLGDYGIVAADLTGLQNGIDAYEAVVASPRVAVTEKATATADIEALFASGDDLLGNRMDKLMGIFKDSDPEFYSTYFNARIIVESGSRTTVLRGVVKELETGVLIGDALVEIVRKDKFGEVVDDGNAEVTATTAEGAYVLEGLRAGTVTLRVSKAGYVLKLVPDVLIERGRTREVDVLMERTGGIVTG